MMILTPFVFLEFTLPLALSISINHNQSDFSDGYFTVIARQAAGKWLDILITIVAVTTMIGTGNGALIVGDEALQSFLVRHQPGLFHSHKKRSAIHHWLVDIDNRVAPSIVFLNSAILIVCALLPLDLILSSSMVVFNVSILVFLVAYVKLKRNAKGIEWLFSFGWMSALVLTLFPCSFTLFMTYEALFNYPVTLGIPYINVVATVAIVGVGLLVHLLYKKASGSKAFSKAMRNMMLVDSVGSNMHELVAKHEEEAEDDDDEQQEAEDAALMSRSL
jgi:amino acid transporter